MAVHIGISAREFGEMTPAELIEQVEAYQWRDEQAWIKTAWQTAHFLNVFLKKEDRVDVEDLLPKQEKQKEPQTVDEQVAIMEMWVAALGGIDKRGEVH